MVRKKYLGYILAFFIFLFCGNMDVYAATELTCLYKNGLLSDKVLLMQTSSGKIVIYKNDKNADLSDTGWVRSYDLYTFNDDVEKDSSGYLTKCPASKTTDADGSGKVTFYGGSKGNCSLESSSSSLELPNGVTETEVNAASSADIQFKKVEITSCQDLFGNSTELVEMLSDFVVLVKVLIPIILLVAGSLDFVQGIFAQSDDVIKKAQQKFIKRLIIAVIIFLIPSALKVILTIAHEVWGFISPDFCGIL